MMWYEGRCECVIELRSSDTTSPVDGDGDEMIQTDKVRLPTSETALTELLI